LPAIEAPRAQKSSPKPTFRVYKRAGPAPTSRPASQQSPPSPS
jgi:hypothetical protein